MGVYQRWPRQSRTAFSTTLWSTSQDFFCVQIQTEDVQTFVSYLPASSHIELHRGPLRISLYSPTIFIILEPPVDIPSCFSSQTWVYRLFFVASCSTSAFTTTAFSLCSSSYTPSAYPPLLFLLILASISLLSCLINCPRASTIGWKFYSFKYIMCNRLIICEVTVSNYEPNKGSPLKCTNARR